MFTRIIKKLEGCLNKKIDGSDAYGNDKRENNVNIGRVYGERNFGN